jgi:hypothetical protein
MLTKVYDSESVARIQATLKQQIPELDGARKDLSDLITEYPSCQMSILESLDEKTVDSILGDRDTIISDTTFDFDHLVTISGPYRKVQRQLATKRSMAIPERDEDGVSRPETSHSTSMDTTIKPFNPEEDLIDLSSDVARDEPSISDAKSSDRDHHPDLDGLHFRATQSSNPYDYNTLAGEYEPPKGSISSREVIQLMEHLTERDKARQKSEADMLATMIATAANMQREFNEIREAHEEILALSERDPRATEILKRLNSVISLRQPSVQEQSPAKEQLTTESTRTSPYAAALSLEATETTRPKTSSSQATARTTTDPLVERWPTREGLGLEQPPEIRRPDTSGSQAAAANIKMPRIGKPSRWSTVTEAEKFQFRTQKQRSKATGATTILPRNSTTVAEAEKPEGDGQESSNEPQRRPMPYIPRISEWGARHDKELPSGRKRYLKSLYLDDNFSTASSVCTNAISDIAVDTHLPPPGGTRVRAIPRRPDISIASKPVQEGSGPSQTKQPRRPPGPRPMRSFIDIPIERDTMVRRAVDAADIKRESSKPEKSGRSMEESVDEDITKKWYELGIPTDRFLDGSGPGDKKDAGQMLSENRQRRRRRSQISLRLPSALDETRPSILSRDLQG